MPILYEFYKFHHIDSHTLNLSLDVGWYWGKYIAITRAFVFIVEKIIESFIQHFFTMAICEMNNIWVFRVMR